MSKRFANVIRGRMTDADRAEIERLAGTMKNPTSGKIARKINRHVATVNSYMFSRGLIERKVGRASRVYQRNGKTVTPYAEEHDAFIEGLSSLGMNYRQIAEAVTAEFGIRRNCYSVRIRLIQLAAAPDEQLSPPPASFSFHHVRRHHANSRSQTKRPQDRPRERPPVRQGP